MLKTVFLTSLKLLVAAALIAWLLYSGKLDFSLLVQLKDHVLEVILAALIFMSSIVIMSFRLKGILKSRSTVNIPATGLVKTSWIGQFFSTVLPGTVSGDLVKVLYIQRFDPAFSKKFVLAALLIDRAMGFCGVILLVGLSSLFFYEQILSKSPDMKPLLLINYALAGAIFAGFLVFIFFPGYVRKVFTMAEKTFFPSIWNRVGNLWDDLVSIKTQMLQALLFSLMIQLAAVLAFWALIHPFVEDKMSFVQALAFIPLGLMTLTLPIAPSGLGVGHAIFQKLFEFSGIQNGASLFNLYFVVTLVVNVMGVIPYLLNKSRSN